MGARKGYARSYNLQSGKTKRNVPKSVTMASQKYAKKTQHFSHLWAQKKQISRLSYL